METNNKDQLVRSFLQQQKKEVNDDFFTEGVLRKLPARKKTYEWIVVVLAAIGTAVSLMLVWLIGTPTISIPFPSEINLYYLVGSVFASPFVGWLCFELFNTKHIRIF